METINHVKPGESIIMEYKDLMTGKTVNYVYTAVEPKCGFRHLYICENHYYVYGIIGWFNVDEYIK